MVHDIDRVRNGLREAITLLLKTGLQFQRELTVEGLLGITLDKKDVFLVSINEVIGSPYNNSNWRKENNEKPAHRHDRSANKRSDKQNSSSLCDAIRVSDNSYERSLRKSAHPPSQDRHTPLNLAKKRRRHSSGGEESPLVIDEGNDSSDSHNATHWHGQSDVLVDTQHLFNLKHSSPHNSNHSGSPHQLSQDNQILNFSISNTQSKTNDTGNVKQEHPKNNLSNSSSPAQPLDFKRTLLDSPDGKRPHLEHVMASIKVEKTDSPPNQSAVNNSAEPTDLSALGPHGLTAEQIHAFNPSDHFGAPVFPGMPDIFSHPIGQPLTAMQAALSGMPSFPISSSAPQQSQVIEKPAAPPSNSKCTNCGTTVTTVWRRNGEGELVCNPCGLYYKLHQPRTPPSSLSSPSPGGLGGHRSETACANCGTTNTTMWRRNDSGSPVCNPCGLYFKLHKVNRPLSLVKPQIFSRRRRPKSYNAGGGNMEVDYSSQDAFFMGTSLTEHLQLSSGMSETYQSIDSSPHTTPQKGESETLSAGSSPSSERYKPEVVPGTGYMIEAKSGKKTLMESKSEHKSGGNEETKNSSKREEFAQVERNDSGNSSKSDAETRPAKDGAIIAALESTGIIAGRGDNGVDRISNPSTPQTKDDSHDRGDSNEMDPAAVTT